MTDGWVREDGAWVLLSRGAAVMYVQSDNPRGYGTVRASGPTTNLEIALGHNDVRGSREDAEAAVMALVDHYIVWGLENRW